MMFDPIPAPFPLDPYRTQPPRMFDAEQTRLPYDGQTRMCLTVCAGLAHARIVVDPGARDLVAIESGHGPRPWIRLAAGEVELTWRVSFGDWLRDLFTAGHHDVMIILHPAVEWTVAIRGGLSQLECDLSAGAVGRIDIEGGCSEVLFDLPRPTSIVPIWIAGGASHVSLRRPADAGVTVGVKGGLSMLWLDDRELDAIGGAAHFDTGDVAGDTPRYELAIRGGASDLSIERR
ncbi:MAG: hypothetical protein WKG01_13195 [Kofleriaceae bacterium]